MGLFLPTYAHFLRPGPSEDTKKQAVKYGRALIATLKAFDVLEDRAGWFERLLIRLLRSTYRQRLRAIVEHAPADVSNRIFEDEKEPLWLG